MRLVNVELDDHCQLGFERSGKIFVFEKRWADLNGIPSTILDAVLMGNGFSSKVEPILDKHLETEETVSYMKVYSAEEIQYGSTVPRGHKIVCVGLNYKKHADESNMELPASPLLFSKFDNTLIGHNKVVNGSLTTEKLDYEAEIGIVIGRRAKNVEVDSALDYVFGLTIANDISARDLQFVTSQWLLGKSCDDFCPTGPYLVTVDEVADPNRLRISCTVNGEVRQDSSTSLMIFSLQELVSYISQFITLEPGDLILSGTPDGVVLGMPEREQVWLRPGDEVVVEVDKLGKLRTIIG